MPPEVSPGRAHVGDLELNWRLVSLCQSELVLVGAKFVPDKAFHRRASGLASRKQKGRR